MTERENEIFQWIKENPFISQQEIAERANITRSSVAVHISNLMKKGKIIGKGYVVQEEGYITVIGGTNVDISGTSNSTLLKEDSNPGSITINHGGVGRNISENLKRLDRQVEFITVLGDDMYGQEIMKYLRGLGVGVQHSMIRQGERTSTYLCINDSNGTMRLAVNDMKLYESLNREFLQTKLDIINRSDLVLIDSNLSEDAILFLAKNCTVPIFAEPVSIKKAGKFKQVLSYIDTLKTNRFELEVLSGRKIADEESLKKAMEDLLEIGVKNLFVLVGKNKIYYANQKKQGKVICSHYNVVNTTGCSDAVMSALALARQEEYSIEETARFCLSAFVVCMESKLCISDEWSFTNLHNRAKKIKQEEKISNKNDMIQK